MTVIEDVGMTELCASTNDELEREVVVSVVYQDRGAIGESSIVPPIIYMITFFSLFFSCSVVNDGNLFREKYPKLNFILLIFSSFSHYGIPKVSQCTQSHFASYISLS